MRCIFFVICAVLYTLTLSAGCSSGEKRGVFSDNSLPLNNLEVIQDISSGDKKPERRSSVIKPSDYKQAKPERIKASNSDIIVNLYARKFAQGNGVYAEIESNGGGMNPEIQSVTWNNIKFPVTKTSWGSRALWGIDPEEKPGKHGVAVNYRVNGKEAVLTTEINVRDVNYPVSKSMLNVGKFSDKDYTSDPKFKQLITECSALRTKAFSSVTEDSIGSAIAYPRDMHKITGDYWRKRIYLKYSSKGKKKKTVEGKKSFHRGLDLKGDIGAPVYAMADGVVVLSHKMFYEGEMVVIDHGNQVFSYYQHLDSRKVTAGERVKAGSLIGGVGATGMVTGPHLHVAFSIRGVHIDPLSVLSLPVSR